MGGKSLIFQYDSMASAYQELLSEKQELEVLLTKLTNEVETVRSIMKGDAIDAYYNEYNEIVEATYRSVNAQVEMFGNMLDQMQQSMAAEDMDIASSIGNV
ncbi:MAG: WXG100 family type VII secretion target [Eubacterium sp.]|nr:WXG100 family type VII secretion target [Eubacterium sp.]